MPDSPGGNCPAAQSGDVPRRNLSFSHLQVILVAATAAGLALMLYSHFLTVHRDLWPNAHHDRNAHYLFGLQLAEDLQQGKVFSVLKRLDSARIWPPLHGMVLAPILAVGGFDYRLAVLPSLAGWVGAAVLGFLVARRSVRHGGQLAGLTAALFILASPAYRVLATDIMLESLGACLSLAVLYFYLVCVQDARKWSGAALGLTLTALFFHKYNYWLLLVLALVVAEAVARPGAYWRALGEILTTTDWRGWLRRQVRWPLNYLLAATLVFLVAILSGLESVSLMNRRVRLYPPFNVVTVAYVLLFIGLVAWWRNQGSRWSRALDFRYRDLMLWHCWPVAVSFLLPKRLGIFLWYLSPANFHGDVRPTLAQSMSFYGNIALSDYHFSLTSGVVALALVVAALVLTLARTCFARSVNVLKPGGHVAICLFLIGAWLTASHPCLLGRYLHSWFAAGWVAAGIGLASVLQVRFLTRQPYVRAWMAVALVLGLALVHAPALARTRYLPGDGSEGRDACILDVTDGYLAALNEHERVTVFATVPFRFLSEWTYAERYGGHARLESHWFGFGKCGEENRAGFQRWLEESSCSTVVFVDRLPGANNCYIVPEEPECALIGELGEVLRTQTTFQMVGRQDHPQHGLSVTIWRRTLDRRHGSNPSLQAAH